MIVKKIEACDVMPHLEKGRSVILVNFGGKRITREVGVYDLADCKIKTILDVIKTPGNKFFEKIEEIEEE